MDFKAKLGGKRLLTGKIQACLVLMIWLLAPVATPGRAQDQLYGKALVEALRQGGFNIYFRHAATDWSQDDYISAQGDWTSCDPQKMRQLSAQGRAAAQRIGEAMRRLGIPVGRVFSSEYCRTRETAQLMDLGPVAPTLAVMNMRAAEFVGGREAVIARARRALSTPPSTGTNNVFVAHGNLMQAASGAYTGESGAAIFAPQDNGEFRLVAQISPEDWEMLAGKFAIAED
ncbi:MAG: histidine phosphatase family protein [Desulfobacteraceae bacterium]|nr:MAG: histidine phosphatase family protein [Desulfobacteraceae bacterium]